MFGVCQIWRQSQGKTLGQKRPYSTGGAEMSEDKQDLEDTVARLRDTLSKYQEAKKLAEDRNLQFRWRAALRTFGTTEERRTRSADYPRMHRLFDIVRDDGKVRLMLSYGQYNPDPDFTNEGQRRQVEALLKFGQPLMQLMEEAGSLWRAGDFEGEAALLEDYAISNPQRDAILSLAEEARRDALSGASTRSKPKRR